MRVFLCSAIALASLSTICSAQTITQNFGTGANAFSIDFVTIGNPGNTADSGNIFNSGPYTAGSVSYTFNLGKYEISRDTIDKANAIGGLGITMFDMNYAVLSGGGNGASRPATGITWSEAARFVNFLNTGFGYKPAYKFDAYGNFQVWSIGDEGFNAQNPYRNSQATFFIPSVNEWYKGAYGSISGTWYNYPTGSNTPPTPVTGGTNPNTAVWGKGSWDGPADIDNAGGLSNWGTMGQGGNVWEWNESAFDGSNNLSGEDRVLRGGDWESGVANQLGKTYILNVSPTDGDNAVWGFRVAMVPEPSSLSLLVLGAVVAMGVRRKR
jgi:formylglycine-generating enzyme required for sulfatase activity